MKKKSILLYSFMRPYPGLIIILFFSFKMLTVYAQPNACGVKAGFVMTPVDKTMDGITYTYYEIQNTSTGAANVVYSFHDDVYNEFWGQISFPAGPNIIKQIAINGECRDTMVYVLFVPGRIPAVKTNITAHIGHLESSFQPKSITNTADGKIIVNTNELALGYTYANLFKMDRFGCIEKSISSNYMAKWGPTTSDGKGNNLMSFVTGIWIETGIARLTDNLDISWAKVFLLDYGSLYPQLYANLPGGQFAAVSNFPDPFASPDVIVTRHQSDGSVLWAKHLEFPEFMSTYNSNMAVIGDRIFAHFRHSIFKIDHWETLDQVIAFDLATGNIIWQKKFGTPEKIYVINDLAAQNGKLILTGSVVDPDRGLGYINTIIELDSDGNVLRTADLFNPDHYKISPGATFRFKDIDGQHFYLDLGGIIMDRSDINVWYSSIIKMNPDWSVEWKRIRAERGLGPIGYGAVLGDGSLAAFGTSLGGNMIPYHQNYNLHYQAFDKDFNQNSRICEFYDFDFQVKPVPDLPVTTLPNAPSTDIQITVKDTTIETAPVDLTIRFTDEKCQDYLDACSMIRITGPEKICNLQGTYTFKAWRSAECTQNVSWEVPANASIVQQSGNTIELRFSALPEGFLKAFIPNSCISVRDSVKVKFSDGFIGPVNLGNDTTICPNSLFNLEPAPGYEHYTWSDGSNGNILRVDKPGKYWVQVQDACGGIFSDTILVTERLKVLINAGPDLDLCPGTPAEVIAPEGYESYRWTNESQVLVSPHLRLSIADGLPGKYFLEAQKTGGCIAYDTITITNKIASTLNLGADTSICQGTIIQFDAGNSFSSYRWSTGDSVSAINVSYEGMYTVTAIDFNGCYVVDSRQLVTLYQLPRINFNKADYLCGGESRILDAGTGYSDYTWQDGSNASIFTVTGIGKYWVTVTDNHLCKGTDTVEIVRITEPPDAFLAPDTTICFYGEKRLAPTASFVSYEWSTGENSASINVNEPGEYWLLATDGDGCKGRDQIVLTGVECMTGIHFPTAFSPNGDGRNDLFKPLIYSPLDQYEFSVFNRFGQIVFSSRDPQKGWNGLVNGKEQDPNTFTWTCTYKFRGKSSRKERGIVILVH